MPTTHPCVALAYADISDVYLVVNVAEEYEDLVVAISLVDIEMFRFNALDASGDVFDDEGVVPDVDVDGIEDERNALSNS